MMKKFANFYVDVLKMPTQICVKKKIKILVKLKDLINFVLYFGLISVKKVTLQFSNI